MKNTKVDQLKKKLMELSNIFRARQGVLDAERKEKEKLIETITHYKKNLQEREDALAEKEKVILELRSTTRTLENFRWVVWVWYSICLLLSHTSWTCEFIPLLLSLYLGWCWFSWASPLTHAYYTFYHTLTNTASMHFIYQLGLYWTIVCSSWGQKETPLEHT